MSDQISSLERSYTSHLNYDKKIVECSDLIIKRKIKMMLWPSIRPE